MKNLDINIQAISYSGAYTNDPADSIRLFNQICDNKIVNVSRQQYQIPTATLASITLPDSNCDYLIILTDTPLTLYVNSSVTPINLTPKVAGVKTFAYYSKGSVSALSVDNTSGSTANIDILIATLE